MNKTDVSRVTETTIEAFQNRIQKVNENRESRTVLTSIDAPMRPLVFELSRIGLVPKFSCCGFTYVGQENEEQKTHHAGMSYVHLMIKNDKHSMNSFFNLCETAIRCGWRMFYFNGGIWNLYMTPSVPDTMYSKKDGIEEAIHQYEAYALGIKNLTYRLSLMETVCDPVTIVDGNSQYTHVDTWQVKPKQDFVVGVDEFYETYGKPMSIDCMKPADVI